MVQPKCYENYPLWIVAISNLVSISICAIGAYIVYLFGIIWAIIYLLYILFLEIRLLKKGCINCYYYGKYCAFGRGRICALFFGKGSPRRFIENKITWKDILPDFLVSIIPMIAGTALLVSNFD